MFMISFPLGFKVGDTVDCRINREPARVTWRDTDHLVIEPNDARVIMAVDKEDNLITFVCGTPTQRPKTTKWTQGTSLPVGSSSAARIRHRG